MGSNNFSMSSFPSFPKPAIERNRRPLVSPLLTNPRERRKRKREREISEEIEDRIDSLDVSKGGH